MAEEVTCTISRDGEEIASASVEANTEVVSRNGAVMKVVSDDEIDWGDGAGYNLSCDG